MRAAEDQSRLYGTWTQGGEAYIQADSACSDICKTLSNDATVRSVVLSQLRTCDHGSPGELHHFVRGSNFSKAYMLNRFLVHLLRHCYVKETNSPLWSNVMKYHVHWQANAMAGHSLPSGETQVDIKQAGGGTAQPRYLFDAVVVRYGIEENSMPARQMVRLSQNESGQRTTLAQVHLPHLLYG